MVTSRHSPPNVACWDSISWMSQIRPVAHAPAFPARVDRADPKSVGIARGQSDRARARLGSATATVRHAPSLAWRWS